MVPVDFGVAIVERAAQVRCGLMDVARVVVPLRQLRPLQARIDETAGLSPRRAFFLKGLFRKKFGIAFFGILFGMPCYIRI